MQRDLVNRYDLRVPRYTSYPTAPHFHGGITGEQYAQWLKSLPADETVSLYLHIAYCAELCWFCGCHTKITRQYAPVAAYMDSLWREIAMVREHLPARLQSRHIHFGGGSPTILTPDDFTKTINLLRDSFNVLDDAEIAVELDPRTADEAYVRAIAAAGVTRASIGVQDFDPTVQKAINRIQPYEVNARVIDWLRAAGVNDINLDLVYGLPFQTLEGLLDTVRKAVDFAPKRIALFGYAHVPWMKKHQRLIPPESLPDADIRWQQYEQASHLLESLGYVRIGLDHFALPDDDLALALTERRLHRNFQGYTTDTARTLLGFGATAIGALPQGYVVNDGEIHSWRTTIDHGEFATRRGVAFSNDDLLRRDLIMTLMCDLDVDVAAVCTRYGVDPTVFDADLGKLDPMIADGLLTLQNRHIVMTETGRTLVRAAASIFDTYLGKGDATPRHSQAV